MRARAWTDGTEMKENINYSVYLYFVYRRTGLMLFSSWYGGGHVSRISGITFSIREINSRLYYIYYGSRHVKLRLRGCTMHVYTLRIAPPTFVTVDYLSNAKARI